MDPRPLGPELRARLPAQVRGFATRFVARQQFDLHPQEAVLAVDMESTRRADFGAGRECARRALTALGITGAVLTHRDGAPRWPAGVRGSISHKDGVVVAVVGPEHIIEGIGVDLEVERPLPPTVLTRAELGEVVGDDADCAGRLAFSAKEAYYKWLRSSGDRSAVGFHDVRVVADGGMLRFVSDLPARFPEPTGILARVHGRLLTVVWSPALTARGA